MYLLSIHPSEVERNQEDLQVPQSGLHEEFVSPFSSLSLHGISHQQEVTNTPEWLQYGKDLDMDSQLLEFLSPAHEKTQKHIKFQLCVRH